ncbi:lipopolysaccharide transporter [Chania multitudinisentens RB-25]|uniref:Lipopolysaccharide export system protein LptA n=1 Tax=Chania multitudinisentens RB-25 TaxID=1441930 RepID=W0L7H1_9GAMM|nr:lipopolysaccharide ABC transporter substrate-binding protein LptA [Chania multitudinisentens]AHG19768.1 lipopolysaccharide transporter [Chania multitudinisentens RB-25]
MKFRTKKQLRNLLLVSCILATSTPALALKSDSEQPVSINSLKQALDMQSNVSTFTDEVVIKQGTIEIKADKVVVTRPDGDQNKTYIEAFGKPVTFYQMQDNGKPVKGHAQKVRYDVATQLVTLTGNAYLEQLDSNVQGDNITYLVQQQQMQASSDKGKRVTTVLVPSQLQDKNGQKKSN